MMNFLRSKGKRSERTVEVIPYTVMAPHYDFIMNHVDYVNWASHAIRLADEHNRSGHALTDLACGTGKFAFELARRGYKVTGADGSAEMIQVAKNHAASLHLDVEFFVRSLTETPPSNEQDIILCLYDSTNYLLEQEDLLTFFSKVRTALKQNGIFVFDISTERNSLDHFDDYSDTEPFQTGVYRRHAWYDAEERLQHNEFEFFLHDDTNVYHEHHIQRIWSIEQIVSCLEVTGWQLLGTYADYTMQPGSESNDRVHFTAEPV
ncbi:methyltransferase domain-containing protein [bacterium]|nr:methyltransferase domain-containing protein [bacterium]